MSLLDKGESITLPAGQPVMSGPVELEFLTINGGQPESSDYVEVSVKPRNPPQQTIHERRVRALAAAKEHVDEMVKERNEAGYQKINLSADQRIEYELKVARFLLGEDDYS